MSLSIDLLDKLCGHFAGLLQKGVSFDTYQYQQYPFHHNNRAYHATSLKKSQAKLTPLSKLENSQLAI